MATSGQNPFATFLQKSTPPVIDHLLPKQTTKALAVARERLPPTPDEVSRGWARSRSVYGNVHTRLLALKQRFDDEPLPDNIQTLFEKLADDVIATGRNLQSGVPNSERFGNLLVQGAVITSSQFLAVKSPRKSYLPRQTASNPVSLLKAFGQLFSGVAGAEQTYNTIAMRYGIAAATYVGLFIQLFLDILDQPKAVQSGYRAGTVLGNIVALLIFFVKPLMEVQSGTSAVEKFAASIPNNPQDRLHAFANSLWAEADALQTQLDRVTEIDNTNRPSNAAHDEFIAYQTKLSRVIERLRSLAVRTLDEQQKADIVGATLDAEERDAFAREISPDLTWADLSIAQQATAFTYGPSPNNTGPKTPQLVVANAVMAANIGLSYDNPEIIADYVALTCMLNIVLWTSRGNPHHDGAKSTQLLVENGLPSFFALFFITYPLVANKDQLYFDKNPDKALESTYQMLAANLGYANLAAEGLQFGIKMIGSISSRGVRYLFRRREEGELPIALRRETPAVRQVSSVDEIDEGGEDREGQDGGEEMIASIMVGIPPWGKGELEKLEHDALISRADTGLDWLSEAFSSAGTYHPEIPYFFSG